LHASGKREYPFLDVPAREDPPARTD
jgi:hypothetical protein